MLWGFYFHEYVYFGFLGWSKDVPSLEMSLTWPPQDTLERALSNMILEEYGDHQFMPATSMELVYCNVFLKL